ncbi:MAG: GHKL domain-containing protein [Bacteroidales bacterium]|nr:GHKL domain-containing protein [Bacteroidales bacterium]
MTDDFTKKKLPLFILFLAFSFFMMSMIGNSGESKTSEVAERTAERLEKRLSVLDGYVMEAMDTREGCLEDVPDDMVIYKYENDSLQSWSNQFPIINDDISRRLVVQRLTDISDRVHSQLINADEKVSYMNLGPKWYVIKSYEGEDNIRIIAGIEIKNNLIDDLNSNDNGTDPYLRIGDRYSVAPITTTGGSAVLIDDVPLFKILYNSDHATHFFDNTLLRWMGLLLLVVASILFLAGHKTFKVFFTVTATLTALTLIAFGWEQQIGDSSELFSPTLYADGPVFFSLGALILLNTYITVLHICAYMMRENIAVFVRSVRKKRRLYLTIYAIICVVLGVGTLIYTHMTLKSLILNSNISMELYRGNSQIHYTALVYVSYTGLLFCIMLMIQSVQPLLRELYGIRYNVFRVKNLAAFAFCCSVYFTINSAVLGFRKEQDRVTVWANRLAVERDLGLELQLRSVEEQIASDQLIATLVTMDNTQAMIMGRISEYYLSRTRQGYNTSVKLFSDQDRPGLAYFNEILRSGTAIAQGSNFYFLTDSNGRSRYAGTFAFFSQDKGLIRMLIEIEPDSNREDRGYYSILGRFSNPGDINIPALYSYAKYTSDKMISYKGNYPYPTVYSHVDKGRLYEDGEEVLRLNGYVHFLHLVSDDEMIVISRPKRGAMVYFTSFSYLFLALCAVLYVFARSDEKKKAFKSNYFRTRINTILFVSSFLILASMTVISVIFVYKRNEANMQNLMSTKINTIQALIENRVRKAESWTDLRSQEFSAALEIIGNTTKSDITLYSPSGKVFLSTTPEVFDKMILGSRIDQKAFHNIRHLNQRFFIHREKIDDYSYWSMYAPVFNDQGEMIAIISSPYTDRNYDFRREAFFHAALIFNLFILMLIVSLLFSTREVNSMFSPLIEMGKKMNVADVHNLEYIIYKRDDEISSLVDAYNRMVHDLSDSTKQLAQAERDKAWSQMARQVAHEIKNPLTPIKLQIQRLIRMKQNGNPAWEERFDEVTSVVLEHIDILTETANEFSTFAKLYSEEPVLMDLDKTLKDQLVIFDNKDNVGIQYIGLNDAFVMAPKPQLIRVFVNLITNAVQAVEIQQKEALERGEETVKGKVLISLRNSIRDGYYDVVVEDNGPGVSEENKDRLFTPNFTTKSSGTGLGLAICRNIIEKCDGEISYQKSFVLGGASFIVTLPKHRMH